MEKTQMNIKKYLHNISLKDQDLSVTNKLHVEKNKNIDLKSNDNESNVATHKITCKVIETQTNCLSNSTYQVLPVENVKCSNLIIIVLNYYSIGCTNEEYIKFDKDNLNKYFCYDE